MTIDGKVINIEKIHFIRKESNTDLLISFGPDFLRFHGTPKEVENIFIKLEREFEKFSYNNK